MHLTARLKTAFTVFTLLGLLALPGAGPAAAESPLRIVPSQQQLQLSYAPVVKKVAPAVVNVYAAKVVQNRNPLFDDPIFRHFFGVPGGGGAQVQRSLGSGVIVDPSGLIVTNVHVIKGATDIKVALTDKREFEAKVVLEDKRSDLAVLRIKDGGKSFPYLKFANSDALQVGDVVLAIGNPFGVGQTVTHGIVSAVARTDVGSNNYQFFIQTDAAINPGNSGGALVDLEGKLVGINNMILSRSGGSQGIGFAIPANMVKVVVASAEAGSHAVQRPWLGAKLQAVTQDIAEGLNLKRPIGALVASVYPDGPAARAGVKPGDVITAVDGQEVDDPKAFDYRFATKPLGGTAKLDILRNGRTVTASVALRTAPSRPRDEVTIRSRSPLGGATLANLSPALSDELGLDNTDSGVVIVGVEDGSYADRFNFRRGDIIVSVNGHKIDDTRELARVADEAAYRWRMVVRRNGRNIAVEFSG
ncbi:MAG TPA: Do family serine endopeptidase [Pseudolabrys sp.]|jgi:Do/DeqQ family serine protease|nr:Do family serine endopeptidase [Pseudolabrys sp.]